MRLVRRQASAFLLWAALFTSRGLFAQGILPPGDTVAAADQLKVALRPLDLRYAQPQPILGPVPASIKALYVNAWAFGSSKLWQLVRLADETEINAFVVDVKDDTGCMLYPSAVPTAQEIGANACARTKDARARRDTVRAHITLLRDRLRPLGAPVTFDIFGLTASATGDLGIGQVWEDFIAVADVVLPMVYPSHYYRGAYGFARPNAEPYRVVRNALREALDRSRPRGSSAEIRPYLQAFTLGRRLPRHTPFDIREQIRAAEELGITSWVLWNPRSVYQRDSLRPKRRPSGPAQLSSGSD